VPPVHSESSQVPVRPDGDGMRVGPSGRKRRVVTKKKKKKKKNATRMVEQSFARLRLTGARPETTHTVTTL
jgi:hypothetical protein